MTPLVVSRVLYLAILLHQPPLVDSDAYDKCLNVLTIGGLHHKRFSHQNMKQLYHLMRRITKVHSLPKQKFTYLYHQIAGHETNSRTAS